MGIIRDQQTGETIGTIESMILSGGTHCVVARLADGEFYGATTRVKVFPLPDYRHSYAVAEHRAVTWIMDHMDQAEAAQQ